MASELLDKLNAALKDAMRARASDTLACIRLVRAKYEEARNQGEPGEAEAKAGGSDGLLQQVVAAYVKQLKVGIKQLAAAGSRSEPLRNRYAAEVAYLQPYLPGKHDAASTRALVREALAGHVGPEAPQAGPLMGSLLKAHPGLLDPDLVRAAIADLLAAPGGRGKPTG